jgi:hypothetical protein
MVSSLLVFLGGREEQKKTSFLAKGEQNKTKGMSLSTPEPKGANFSLILHNSYKLIARVVPNTSHEKREKCTM